MVVEKLLFCGVCTYAIKERWYQGAQQGGLDTAIFYIDIRTHGKDFERYYNRQDEMGCVHQIEDFSVIPVSDTGDLLIRYTTKLAGGGGRVWDGGFVRGVCISQSSMELARKMGLSTVQRLSRREQF